MLFPRKHLYDIAAAVPFRHTSTNNDNSPLFAITTRLFLLFLIMARICDSGRNFSYSECLQLERSSAGRSAKVVSVREGHPVYLHCPRQQQGKKGANLKVAWTRLGDDALLAVGTNTFTQDPRFQVSKPRKEESDWVLILRRPDPSDQGCYLCEVNTEPTSTLIPVYLKVSTGRSRSASASAEQKRAEEKSGQEEGNEDEEGNALIRKRNTRLRTRIEGDQLVLNCTVERAGSGEQTALRYWPSVVWLHENRPIDLSDTRKYSTDYHVSDDKLVLVFTLRIKVVPASDGGIYACEGDQLMRSTQIVNLVQSKVPNGTAKVAFTSISMSFAAILTIVQIFFISPKT